MMNLSKLIAILLLGLFVTVGCAENKGSSDSISDGSGGNKDLVFKRIYTVNGFVYGETVDGKKYIWGNVGEMLSEGNSDNITTPKEVTFTVKSTYQFYYTVYKIAYVLTDKGLYGWGNDRVQVGNGTTTNVLNPIRIDEQNGKKIIEGNIQEVIVDASTVYVITDTGLYAWGDKTGNGTTENVLSPVRIDEQNGQKIIEGNIQEVMVDANTVYVRTDVGLYAWGSNYSGQLGNGTTENELTPIRIDEQNGQKMIEGNIQEVIVEGSTVYVITDAGLYAWGYNMGGEVGNGTTKNVLIPVRIDEQNDKKIIEGNIQEVIVDGSNVYVRTDIGLYAWGPNYGGVGNGTVENVLSPVRIDEQNGKKIIEGNIQEVIVDASTVYVRTDVGLYAWGPNYRGQLGNGTTENELTPIRIDEQNGKKIIEGNIKEVILYINTVYVITDIGIYAWSNNDFGQVGNGTIHSYVLSPARIDEQNGQKIIEGNIQEVIYSKGNIYVRTDTGLYAWGDNTYGEVGNGTTKNVLIPVRIDEQNDKKIIEGNIQEVIVDGSTVYVRTDSGLYSWGKNDYGQVGNGDSGFEKDENGNITSKPKYVLTPYKI